MTPKLDLYEQHVYNDLITKGHTPKDILKLLINQVEGDESQLSAGLLAYGKEEGLI